MRFFRSFVFAAFALATSLASAAFAGTGGGGANANGGGGMGAANASGGASTTVADGGFVPQSGDSSTGGRAILDPSGSRACACEWNAAPTPTWMSAGALLALALVHRRRRR
jgi:uncharacterized protein (TIGR03382 family)